MPLPPPPDRSHWTPTQLAFLRAREDRVDRQIHWVGVFFLIFYLMFMFGVLADSAEESTDYSDQYTYQDVMPAPAEISTEG